MLKTRDIRYAVGQKEILNGISAEFRQGLFHVIAGPNGSGKSTFLKICSGELKPQRGEVSYGGYPIFQQEKNELAKYRAVMSQQPELYFPLSVREIVMMGRYPHFGFRHSKKDEEICLSAMQKMDVADLKDRDYLTLSGGEKQRVQFARVLSQIWEPYEGKTRLLFLDEAIAHLDLKHQQQLLDIATELCNMGVIVVAVLHDLNLALRYADHMVFMKNGYLSYELFDTSAITAEIIFDIFEVKVSVIFPGGKAPVIVNE